MNEYSITQQFTTEQINQLINLFKQMWWTKDCSENEVSIMLQTSISFGLIENQTKNLVGYARVLTDKIKYAFIFDVMLEEAARRKGLGKFLMNTILTHAHFKDIKNFELTCAPDMMEFYEKFGFSEDYGQVRPMKLCRKDEHLIHIINSNLINKELATQKTQQIQHTYETIKKEKGLNCLS